MLRILLCILRLVIYYHLLRTASENSAKNLNWEKNEEAGWDSDSDDDDEECERKPVDGFLKKTADRLSRTSPFILDSVFKPK